MREKKNWIFWSDITLACVFASKSHSLGWQVEYILWGSSIRHWLCLDGYGFAEARAVYAAMNAVRKKERKEVYLINLKSQINESFNGAALMIFF